VRHDLGNADWRVDLIMRIVTKVVLVLALALAPIPHHGISLNPIIGCSQAASLSLLGGQENVEILSLLIFVSPNKATGNSYIIDYHWDTAGIPPPIKKIEKVGEEYRFDYYWKTAGIPPPIKMISVK
jgi:hypothetical protein